MSQTQVVDVAISTTEVKSIADVAAKIVHEIKDFAKYYGVEDQFDPRKLEEDLIIFLVRRKILDLRELRVSVLEGGDIRLGNTIRGSRRADLLIRIHYKKGGKGRV
jgi:hypothetical protein